MYVVAIVVAAAWAIAAAAYYIGWGICFVVVALCRAIGSQFGRSTRTAQNIRLSLYRADAEVETAARRARQDMNNAAGQSWRNLAG